MDLKQIKKNINARNEEHIHFVNKALEAERYYRCKNDILFKILPGEDPSNPRRAIHRIPSAYYKIIVDEKISYLLGKVPQPDTGKKDLNEKLMKVAGRHYGAQLRRVGLDAANCGFGVWHIWKTGTEYEDVESPAEQEFKYHTVDPKQVVPVFGGSLEEELIAIWRHYEYTDVEGLSWEVHEWWDKTFCYTFRKRKETKTMRSLEPFNKFSYWDIGSQEWKPTNVYKHGFDRVPFIIFKNNTLMTNDLDPVKPLIDAYDEVITEYWDDLEDIQENIWILSGYGREPADGFLEKLKQNKLIKLESGYPDGVDPKLEMLSIEIPTEARKLGMETARKGMFEQGMAIDQTPEVLSYTSGEALKYRNALMELKASITQDEFDNAINIFFREIAKFIGEDLTADEIELRWTRNKVDNDTELMNNARLCLGFTSLRTALKVNPYVEDVDEELERIEEERQKEMENALEYGDMNILRRSTSYNRNYQSSQERVLNKRDSENKSYSQEKYIVGKAVNGQDSGRGN